jgi:hypothetical protein
VAATRIQVRQGDRGSMRPSESIAFLITLRNSIGFIGAQRTWVTANTCSGPRYLRTGISSPIGSHDIWGDVLCQDLVDHIKRWDSNIGGDIETLVGNFNIVELSAGLKVSEEAV